MRNPRCRCCGQDLPDAHDLRLMEVWTKKESEMLRALEGGKWVTTHDIIREAYGVLPVDEDQDRSYRDRVGQHMHRLRAKLVELKLPWVVNNKQGVGYQLRQVAA